ncbi:MAG: hypothetical protein RBR82_02800 [Pseudomonas sp.]|nr:hypothetical protein [Pseudomonas sp.]
MLTQKEITQVLKNTFRLNWHGYHGASHWARVRNNSKIIAKAYPANHAILHYFSLFHDIARIDEGRDYGHGLRAAQFLEKKGGADWLKLTSTEYTELIGAITLHSESHPTGTITQQICWDSDRLDLWRVSTMPDPQRLFTERAIELHEERLSYGYYV